MSRSTNESMVYWLKLLCSIISGTLFGHAIYLIWQPIGQINYIGGIFYGVAGIYVLTLFKHIVFVWKGE